MLSGCRDADAGCSFGTASFALPAAFLAVDLALVVAFFAVAFTPDGFFAAAVARFAVVPALAVVFFAAEVERAVVVRLAVVPALAAAGGLMAEMVLAALVSASAAVMSALVAVFIVFMAVFIACAEDVALLAASVIFVAADETLVAADDTRVAAAAGVTDDLAADVDRVDFLAAGLDAVLRAVLPVVFFAAAVVFFAPPDLVRLVLAVERRADERVIVLVGTDPSPRVDQLRVDLFHNWRRSTRLPGARRSLFPGMWSSGQCPGGPSSRFRRV